MAALHKDLENKIYTMATKLISQVKNQHKSTTNKLQIIKNNIEAVSKASVNANQSQRGNEENN